MHLQYIEVYFTVEMKILYCCHRASGFTSLRPPKISGPALTLCRLLLKLRRVAPPQDSRRLHPYPPPARTLRSCDGGQMLSNGRKASAAFAPEVWVPSGLHREAEQATGGLREAPSRGLDKINTFSFSKKKCRKSHSISMIYPKRLKEFGFLTLY